jgi:hypothetical protein
LLVGLEGTDLQETFLPHPWVLGKQEIRFVLSGRKKVLRKATEW